VLVPRYFDATLVRVDAGEGVTGIGSGDTMENFAGTDQRAGLVARPGPREARRLPFAGHQG
jgi:hypothetical protein